MKLRKMLGKMDSPECQALMRQMETQSKQTLAAWAVAYAKERYLPLYQSAYPAEARLPAALEACAACLRGEGAPAEGKAAQKALRQIASETEGPVAQAAAHAIATACAAVQTPTNAFGFLLYGAAAFAYHSAGVRSSQAVYDPLATEELARARASLRAASVPGELNPATLRWNC